MAKRMSQSDRCRKALRKIAPEGVSDEYIKAVVDKMAAIKAQESARGAKGNFKKAVGEFVAETRIAMARDRVVRAQNITKAKERVGFYNQFGEGQTGSRLGMEAAEGLLAKQGGGQSLKVGINDSVAARRSTYYHDWSSKFTLGMENSGHMKLFQSDALEREISMELFENGRKGGQTGISGSPEAVKIAEVVRAVQKQQLNDLRDAGLPIGEIENRIMKQSWDVKKTKDAGFAAWRGEILNALDHDRTFTYDAGNPEKMDEFLAAAYSSITEGRFEVPEGSGIQTGDELITTSNYSKLGNKLTQKRALHFKDGASFYDFNKKFGDSNLRVATLREMQSNSRNASLISVYGTDPAAAIQADKMRVRARIAKDPEALAAFNNKMNAVDNLYAQVSGDANRPANPTLAKWAAGARALVIMKNLGATTVRSFPDIASNISILSSQTGNGYGRSAATFLDNFVNSFGSQNRREIAAATGYALKDHLGELARMVGGDTVDQAPGRVSKMAANYMKLTLLDSWTEINKSAAVTTLAREGATHAGLEFGALGNQYRRNMERYNIGEKQWNMLRQTVDKIPDGSDVIRPDLIYERNPGADRKALREAELAWKTYTNDIANYGTPEPGDRVRARLNQGTQSGTIAGEAFRFLGQFKAFPVYGYDIGLRVLASNPEKPLTYYRDLLKNQGDMQRFAGLIAGTTAMAYMADSLLHVARNDKPLDPSDPWTWKRALTQGGALGFYGDLVLGEGQRLTSKEGLLGVVAGPVATTLAEGTAIGAKATLNAINGKDQTRNNLEGFNFMVRQAPGNNIFYLKTAMDYMILDRIRNGIDEDYSDRKRARQDNNGGALFDF